MFDQIKLLFQGPMLPERLLNFRRLRIAEAAAPNGETYYFEYYEDPYKSETVITDLWWADEGR